MIGQVEIMNEIEDLFSNECFQDRNLSVIDERSCESDMSFYLVGTKPLEFG